MIFQLFPYRNRLRLAAGPLRLYQRFGIGERPCKAGGMARPPAPKSQGCCGALSTHAGREEESLDFARKTIDTFERLDLDNVIVNAAGCGSTMKEYGHLLRDDPEYSDRARAFSEK